MAEHNLNTWQPTYGLIASSQLNIDARINDRNPKFEVGDQVTFKHYNPGTKKVFKGREVSAELEYVDNFAPALFENYEVEDGFAILGLSRDDEPVLSPEGGPTRLRTQPENFESLDERRVDLRANDREFRHGGAILFQEYDLEEGYTGSETLRQIRRVTEWNPIAAGHYTVEQVRNNPLAVLGWHELLDA